MTDPLLSSKKLVDTATTRNEVSSHPPDRRHRACEKKKKKKKRMGWQLRVSTPYQTSLRRKDVDVLQARVSLQKSRTAGGHTPPSPTPTPWQRKRVLYYYSLPSLSLPHFTVYSSSAFGGTFPLPSNFGIPSSSFFSLSQQ